VGNSVPVRVRPWAQNIVQGSAARARKALRNQWIPALFASSAVRSRPLTSRGTGVIWGGIRRMAGVHRSSERYPMPPIETLTIRSPQRKTCRHESEALRRRGMFLPCFPTGETGGASSTIRRKREAPGSWSVPPSYSGPSTGESEKRPGTPRQRHRPGRGRRAAKTATVNRAMTLSRP